MTIWSDICGLKCISIANRNWDVKEHYSFKIKVTFFYKKSKTFWSLEERPVSQLWRLSERPQDGEAAWRRTWPWVSCSVTLSTCTLECVPRESKTYRSYPGWHLGPRSPVHFSGRPKPQSPEETQFEYVLESSYCSPGHHGLWFLPVQGLTLGPDEP
jgi:hypothetical protein